MAFNWNPLDTVRDVRDFAYNNTGADNFMNIYRGKGSFWGNLGAGLGEAGSLFIPGGGALRAGAGAFKVAKAANAAAKTGKTFTQLAKGAGKEGLSVYKPKTYLTNTLLKQTPKSIGKTAVSRALPIAGMEQGIKYLNEGMNTMSPYSSSATTAQQPTQESYPINTGYNTYVPPTNTTTYTPSTAPTDSGYSQYAPGGAYLGNDAYSDSPSYYDTTAGLVNSGFNSDAKALSDNLIAALSGNSRVAGGTTQDAASTIAASGLPSTLADIIGAYTNSQLQTTNAATRLKAAEELAKLKRQQVSDLNANSFAQANASNSNLNTQLNNYFNGGN